jgi:hypothetical protein
MTTILNTTIEQIDTISEPPRIKALSNAQRIRKVIFELVETEKSYVQVSLSFEYNFQNRKKLVIDNKCYSFRICNV